MCPRRRWVTERYARLESRVGWGRSTGARADQSHDIMFKFILILGLGVAIGYSYGWKDAHLHELNVAERVVGQIGGKSRAMVSGDADAQLIQAEKR